MILRNGLFVALVALSTLVPGVVTATAITDITGGQNTANNTQLNGTLDSSSFSNLGGSSGVGTGTVTLGVTALAKHRPFDIDFEMSNFFNAGGIHTGIHTRNFSFAVTVTNGIGNGTAANPDQLAAAFDDIQNIEFEIVKQNPASNYTFIAPPTTGPAGPFLYTNGSGNSVLRFGGANGGGLAIPSGGSATFNFTVSLNGAPNGTGADWSLRITANPEPTSFLLAGLGMCAFGGGYWRKRRKSQAAANEAEAQPNA